MNRITPVGAPSDYQTYSITSPPDRQVKAACERAGCVGWRHGWQSVIDESTACGATGTGPLCAWAAAGRMPCGTCQATYIRQRSGRTFREQKTGAGLTVFSFESGQRCFAEHQTRPEIYAVRGGDYREITGPTRTHQRATDWQEDFGEHQLRLVDLRQRG
ncbi:hypothetical protein O3Q52_17445 [Streptomyces sp. ActVer]|uniref:hypothetical protein n=1 Tax=Streptomyces sp. ActVer TaxID=3014558 RepID=UPI0022B2BA6B|nr:hypothetical protein [Streptomyces sp. ActVer]MCZ4509950.1 hypothetical protein [Streptomyces sp. ActVer]